MNTFLTAVAAAMILGAPASAQDRATPAVRATLAHAEDRFSLDLVFDLDAPVWVFVESEVIGQGRGWRLDPWTVETPGVLLETVDGHDRLRATTGGPVPREVRLRLTPRFVDLQASYDPVLTFSTGATAWYSEAFNLVPLDSVEAAAGLPDDLTPMAEATGPARVTWSDADGPVLFDGRREIGPVSEGAGTYVLFGPAEVASPDELTTVIDPGLPAWIGEELGTWAPRVADEYRRRLGPGGSDRPMVMMSWTGPTPGATSMAGSVLPHLVVMAFEGDGVVEPSAGVRSMARWFIGHESAHFWLGETVHYRGPQESWITEGGADLMAVRASEALDPGYSGKARLQQSVDDCVALGAQPVSTASARGQHRAHYACGAVFALIAEGAQRRAGGGDWFDFLRPLIDASRADEVLTREEWLSALTAVSGDPSLRADIERLLDEGDAEAAATVASLLQRAGVAATRREGRLLLD
jgi:hypothetical protein